MQNRSLIQRLENKLGKYAVKNLIIYILAAYVIGYVLIITESKLHLYEYIVLDPAMVMQGQVWRLFTWVCSIPQTLGLFVIFVFIFYYFIGKSLENTLGAFKYNLYMFSGWFFMTLGAMVVYWITGASMDVSTYYLNLASFLAFALLYPDAQVYLFFILPIKMKWLALLDVAYLVYRIITYVIALANSSKIDWSYFSDVTEYQYRLVLYAQIFSIIISLLNFIIFFLMVRKVTPKNIKNKVKSAAERHERKQNWNKNWEEARKYWEQNQWTGGETKWNEKSGNDNSAGKDEQQRANDDANQQFRTWSDWYEPGEDQNLRNQRYDDYQNEKKNRETRADRLERKRQERNAKYSTQEFEHRCEICGRTNITNPELSFRFCSRCEGNHEYCEEHIFNHEHI